MKCANWWTLGEPATPPPRAVSRRFYLPKLSIFVTSGKHEDKLAVVTGSPDHGPKCVGLEWSSSSGDDDVYHVPSSSHQRLPCLQRGSRAARRRRPSDSRIPTTPPVCLPPGIQSLPASDADRSFARFRPVNCSLPLRVDDACSTNREDDSDWADLWHVQPSCPASRRDTLIALPRAQTWSAALPGSAPPSRRTGLTT